MNIRAQVDNPVTSAPTLLFDLFSVLTKYSILTVEDKTLLSHIDCHPKVMNRVPSQFEKFYFVLGSHGKRRSLNFESSKERDKILRWENLCFENTKMSEVILDLARNFKSK